MNKIQINLLANSVLVSLELVINNYLDLNTECATY